MTFYRRDVRIDPYALKLIILPSNKSSSECNNSQQFRSLDDILVVYQFCFDTHKIIRSQSVTYNRHKSAKHCRFMVCSGAGTWRSAILANIFEPESRSGKPIVYHSRNVDTAAFWQISSYYN